MIPIDELPDEEIKNELNELLLQAANYFSSFGVAIHSYHDSLDEETSETLIEDAVYYIRGFCRVMDRAGEKHFNMAAIYALFYVLYASNNVLMMDNIWKDYFTGLQQILSSMVPGPTGKFEPGRGYS
jgi:hypothetical protein